MLNLEPIKERQKLVDQPFAWEDYEALIIEVQACRATLGRARAMLENLSTIESNDGPRGWALEAAELVMTIVPLIEAEDA